MSHDTVVSGLLKGVSEKERGRLARRKDAVEQWEV